MKMFAIACTFALALPALAQEPAPRPQPPSQQRTRRPAQSPPAAQPATPSSTEPEAPAQTRQMAQEQSQPAREAEREPRPPQPSQAEAQRGAGGGPSNTSFRFDMKETAPNVTHHSVTVNGRTLRYTATAGRLPIKNGEGTTEALMFYVAYTLDGADAATRPLTFAYNGGPGSATIWLHMGALGPRVVTMDPQGFMTRPPFRLHDNPYAPL